MLDDVVVLVSVDELLDVLDDVVLVDVVVVKLVVLDDVVVLVSVEELLDVLDDVVLVDVVVV